MQQAEGVGETGVHKLGELPALLVGETRRTSVGARVLQVDLLMGHVEVAAHHHRLRVAGGAVGQHAGLKPLAEIAEGIVPFHTVIDARELHLGVRRVHVHEPELGELAGHDASLGIQILVAQTVQHPQRLLAGEHRRARVALLLGGAPVLVVAWQIQLHLAHLALRLLNGEDVRVKGVEHLQEILLQHGANAVHIPRNKSHGTPLLQRPRTIRGLP